MANPTTNYGFVMPTSTDLVTDLPADFGVFGQAVDTQMKTNADAATQKATLTTKGDIYAATGTSTPARLAVGTNGQLLTADSTAATGLAWTTVTGGGMTLISTATPSGATTVSFTSIPTTYKTLLLVWDGVYQSVSDQRFGVRMNNDDSGKHWWMGFQNNNPSSIEVTSGGDETQFGTNVYGSPIPSTPTSAGNINRLAMGQMWIFNADQTTGVKKVHWSSSGYSNSAAGGCGPVSFNGVYTGTSAISRIDFIRNSTQTITGTIRLYGVS